ncbi:MAG: FRG domain-containing protein [Deltaproteobacteria bacterium]|nr:FRG domain-containing protein [Deltaproteobacteria bacterium]
MTNGNFKVFPCSTHKNFLKALDPHESPWSAIRFQPIGWIFRGQPVDAPLVPKALRRKADGKYECHSIERTCRYVRRWFPNGTDEEIQVGAEYDLLRGFIRAADEQGFQLPDVSMKRLNILLSPDQRKKAISRYKLWPEPKHWELLALAQHFGLPTRLLDWSKHPRIAAYFAVREIADPTFKHRDDLERGIVVWALNTRPYVRNNKRIKIIQPPMGWNPNLSTQRGVLTALRAPNGDGLESAVENETLIKIVLKPDDPKTLTTEASETLYRLFEEGIHAASMFRNLTGAAQYPEERRLYPDNAKFMK